MLGHNLHVQQTLNQGKTLKTAKLNVVVTGDDVPPPLFLLPSSKLISTPLR